MLLQLTAGHLTAAGRRDHNDDAVGITMPTDPDRTVRGVIAVIADGVSSSHRGSEAASHAVRELLHRYYAVPQTGDTLQLLKESLESINRWIHAQGSDHKEQGDMATTLTALVLRDNFYYFSHVGDSRLYRLRDSELEQLTIDHVWDQSERRHVLTRAIGLDSYVDLDQGTGELKQGDIFLLATDGVWASLPEHELSWHLSELIDDKRTADGTAQLLVDAALAAGSTDNLSALIVRVDQLPEIKQDEEKPPEADRVIRRNPLAVWKIIGALSLLANLLLYLLVFR